MKYCVEYVMKGSIEVEADSKEEAISSIADLSELELMDNIYNTTAVDAVESEA